MSKAQPKNRSTGNTRSATMTQSTQNEVFLGVGIDWMDESQWMSAPIQNRGRQTVQKILHAGKQLFVENGYEESSMQAICKQAGVSMGALYHHFPDKQSLLYTLLELYRKSRFEQIDELVNSRDWTEASAAKVLAFHIEIMFSSARSDMGFQRLMERQRIVDDHVCQLLIDWNEHVVQVIHALMKPFEAQINRPDLLDALRYTHAILRGALLWALLPPKHDNAVLDPLSDTYRNVTYDMAAAYLGID